ncbi:hypothetical protein GF325_17785 [Candidatus Bathyarchaeota archaeon]|nr:hypothetical protein [Candidatus Bathyarchaeota archaeon]
MQVGKFSFARGEKMVFVDWLHVDAGYGFKARGKAPEKMPRGVKIVNVKPWITLDPILEADKPWEADFIGAYISMVQEDDGRYRVWYEAFPDYKNDGTSFLCHAISHDGMHWEKPDVGLVEWNGTLENNILFTPAMHPRGHGLHGLYVFKDSNPSCKHDERYKLVYTAPDPEGRGRRCHGAVSPDGLRWHLLDDPIVKEPCWADTQTIIEWNDNLACYIGFFRSWWHNRRQVYQGTSTDFSRWKNLTPVLVSDPNFPPDHDWYTNGFHQWPGAQNASILMPTIYRRSKDDLQVEMRASRDTTHWYRLPINPILDPSQRKIFQGGVYLGHGIITLPDGTWNLPVGVPGYFHNETRIPGSRKGKVFLAKWRQDGFTGIKACPEGSFWTQPFRFSGSSVEINLDAPPGGHARIGIQDEFTGKYLPGFSIDDCRIPGHYETWHQLAWRNGGSLEEYQDCRIRLHVELLRSTVHGFRFL